MWEAKWKFTWSNAPVKVAEVGNWPALHTGTLLHTLLIAARDFSRLAKYPRHEGVAASKQVLLVVFGWRTGASGTGIVVAKVTMGVAVRIEMILESRIFFDRESSM